MEFREWNGQQKILRSLFESGQDHSAALEFFMRQHSALHSSNINPPNNKSFSFEDLLLDDLDDELFRRKRANDEHSIAWCIWHSARIEDVTMNRLVAGEPQLFHKNSWADELGFPAVHTGNAMTDDEMFDFCQHIQFEPLRAYRLSVGRRTQEIVGKLSQADLKQKVLANRLKMIVEEEAIVQEAMGLVDYWAKRTIAGMLLMPPTRHNMVHLNEAAKLKNKR
ncbi:MAG: DinB family protein [Candidatus Promineifilaceae bacterium]